MSINIGIAGLAHGHVEKYVSLWMEKPEMGVNVAAGWDHDASRLAAFAQRHGILPCAALDDLINRKDIQAVVVAAETSLHAEIVERVAAAGKAIVLQKPMALTMAQANRIVEAVQGNGVPFSMAWQMRVDPQNIEMMRLVHTQALGRVLNVRRRHALATHLWTGFENTWHNNPVYNRDIWADDSAHPIDWINALFGAPESVTAEIVSMLNPRIPNDNGIAIFRYQNGPLVEVNCSFTCAAAISTTEIVCERGVIIQNYGDAPSAAAPRTESDLGLKWYSVETGQWTYFHVPSPSEQGIRISGLAQPIADFLNGRRGPIATAQEPRLSLRMVLATYVSARQGRRVSMDDTAIDEFI